MFEINQQNEQTFNDKKTQFFGVFSNSVIRTSWYSIIEGGEASKYLRDFTLFYISNHHHPT
jgi:hypothetical protein